MSDTIPVLGRATAQSPQSGQTCRIGRYRAPDGSLGSPVDVDLDYPHVAAVVGKRGSGKSYTLGVLAEALAAAPGVAPVVVDTMGVFDGLADAGVRVVEPRVRPEAIPAAHWPAVVGLDPVGPAGSLVWRAADGATSVAAMRERVAASSARPEVARAADNHLALAAAWGCFAPDGLAASDLRDSAGTVLPCGGLSRAARVAVVAAVARALYRDARDNAGVLPWLLVDEAHACYGGPARAPLDAILTRGRSPGVSLVLATQRPSALPEVAVAQTDLVVAHRLTADADVTALAAVDRGTDGDALADRLPSRPGDAVVLDDATGVTAAVRVRERHTPHGGGSPRASRRVRKH